MRLSLALVLVCSPLAAWAGDFDALGETDGIECLPDGSVAILGPGGVTVFGPEGAEVRTWPVSLNGARGLVGEGVGGDPRLAAWDDDEVCFTQQGRFVCEEVELTGINYPKLVGALLLPDGTVLAAADKHALMERLPDGSWQRHPYPEALGEQVVAVVGAGGEAFVVGTGPVPHRVVRDSGPGARFRLEPLSVHLVDRFDEPMAPRSAWYSAGTGTLWVASWATLAAIHNVGGAAGGAPRVDTLTAPFAAQRLTGVSEGGEDLVLLSSNKVVGLLHGRDKLVATLPRVQRGPHPFVRDACLDLRRKRVLMTANFSKTLVQPVASVLEDRPGKIPKVKGKRPEPPSDVRSTWSLSVGFGPMWDLSDQVEGAQLAVDLRVYPRLTFGREKMGWYLLPWVGYGYEAGAFEGHHAQLGVGGGYFEGAWGLGARLSGTLGARAGDLVGGVREGLVFETLYGVLQIEGAHQALATPSGLVHDGRLTVHVDVLRLLGVVFLFGIL